MAQKSETARVLEATIKRCEKILDLLQSRSSDQPVGLWEYIRSVQFVILVIDQYSRTKKDDRPKLTTNLSETSLLFYTQLEQLCLPEHKEVFNHLLASHRLCHTFDQIHISLYKEASQMASDLAITDGKKSVKSPGRAHAKTEKDGQPRKTYAFASEHNSFSSQIKDGAGEKFWEDSFEGTFMVSWPSFLKALAKECGNISEDDAKRLQYVLDPSRTAHVSVFRFANFLKVFGPLKDCVRKTNQELQYPYFQGFMSHAEVKKLLSGQPIGTYITRLSKTKPENIIVSRVEEKDIANILLEACPEGFKTINSSTVKIVPSLDELVNQHRQALREGFGLELMRYEYFYSDLNDWEAQNLLRKHQKGAWLVRFETLTLPPGAAQPKEPVTASQAAPSSLAVSYVDAQDVVKHYRGLKYQRDSDGKISFHFEKYKHKFKSLNTLNICLQGLQQPVTSITFDVRFHSDVNATPGTNNLDKKNWLERRAPTPDINQSLIRIGTREPPFVPQPAEVLYEILPGQKSLRSDYKPIVSLSGMNSQRLPTEEPLYDELPPIGINKGLMGLGTSPHNSPGFLSPKSNSPMETRRSKVEYGLLPNFGQQDEGLYTALAIGQNGMVIPSHLETPPPKQHVAPPVLTQDQGLYDEQYLGPSTMTQATPQHSYFMSSQYTMPSSNAMPSYLSAVNAPRPPGPNPNMPSAMFGNNGMPRSGTVNDSSKTNYSGF